MNVSVSSVMYGMYSKMHVPGGISLIVSTPSNCESASMIKPHENAAKSANISQALLFITVFFCGESEGRARYSTVSCLQAV